MRRLRVKLAIGVAVLGVVVTAAVAVAGDRSRSDFRTSLTGYEEVPALSTPGGGFFKAALSRHSDEIRYELTFGRLESDATQSHIHFEQQTNNGPVVVFLCSNLPNAPAGTQACPADGGTISGTITPADVGAGGAAQGLEAGNFDELVSAMRSGAMYVNVHSVDRPGGEIRGQLDGFSGRHHR
jgi:hypothetical protein